MSAAPDIRVELGFETTTDFGNPFQLDSATYGLLDTGTLGGIQFADLTSMVQAVTINRGRNRELEQFTAGTAAIRFHDPSRILDPLNTASAYYPFVNPRNPVRVYANDVQIYSGLVTDWDIEYGKTESANVTTASCADAFTVLANQSLSAFTPAEQASGARVNAVLDRSEIRYQGPRSIDAGSSTLGAFEISEGQNALQYLQLVAASEQGYLFVAGDGTLTFRGRAASLNASANITFVDTGASIKYQTLTNTHGDELLYNYVTTQSPAGAVQTASDAASIALYQAQQYSKLDLLNSTTAQVADLGNYLVGRYHNPQMRFTGVSVELAALSAADQATCLGVDMTDIASVQKSYSAGAPASVTQTLITSGVGHDIRPGSHVITFTFESTDANNYLTLDSAIFGALDDDLLAF